MANLALPNPSEPVIDPKTGRMTKNWYQYFVALTKLINGAL